MPSATNFSRFRKNSVDASSRTAGSAQAEAAPLHCSCDQALWALHRQVSRVKKEYNGGLSRVGLGLWLFCGKMLA
jgi:hypothetical protein